MNYGDLGFIQTKASLTGPFGEKVAGRLSFSGTNRGGTVYNTSTQDHVNDLDNLGVRGQLLFAPSGNLAVTWATDYSRQRPDGYTQVVAGVAPTLRPANRQYPQIAADLGYVPPSFNAFDRLTDVDSPLRSIPGSGRHLVDDRLEGRPGPHDVDDRVAASGTGIRRTIATSSACRSPRSRRRPRSSGSGRRRSATRRTVSPRLNYVAGAFAFYQSIDSNPSFVQEQGSAAARFLLAPSAAASTPGLLDGYGYNQYVDYGNTSAALFGQIEWKADRAAAAAARPSLQLRPQGRRLRPAGLRRPADDRSRR